jgi:hypothetical protein
MVRAARMMLKTSLLEQFKQVSPEKLGVGPHQQL